MPNCLLKLCESLVPPGTKSPGCPVGHTAFLCPHTATAEASKLQLGSQVGAKGSGYFLMWPSWLCFLGRPQTKSLTQPAVKAAHGQGGPNSQYNPGSLQGTARARLAPQALRGGPRSSSLNKGSQSRLHLSTLHILAGLWKFPCTGRLQIVLPLPFLPAMFCSSQAFSVFSPFDLKLIIFPSSWWFLWIKRTIKVSNRYNCHRV